MTPGGTRQKQWRQIAAANLLTWSLIALVIVGCGSSEGAADQFAPVQPSAGSFLSNGHIVRIEEVPGSGPQPRPAVIMLHGASGVGSGWMIYPYADAIARRGMDAFVVQYFDGLSPGVGDRSGVAYFAERDRIIKDAIGYVASLPGTDPRRIGLFGLSLGGFHAVGLAARSPEVAAVVDLMGAMPRSVPHGSVRRMPPTLILHGARDNVVPVERAADLALLLGRVGAPFEMKIYLERGHALSGDDHGNSIRLTADFFDRHLGARADSRR